MRKEDKTKPVVGDGRPTSANVDALVGDRLRLRRKVLGLTLAELGDRCAVSAQQIHKYEQGVSSMSAGRLAQFSEALAVPVGWFFDGGEADQGLPSELLNLLTDPHNMEVISLLMQVKEPKAKKLAISLIKEVAKYTSGKLWRALALLQLPQR